MTGPGQLRELFDAALGLQTDEERRDFLDQACGGEPKLRQRVSTLGGRGAFHAALEIFGD